MPVTIDSSRFGIVEISAEEVIEFPDGLIGLDGTRYALLDRNPGSGFSWLHSVDDPALALPVVDPRAFFSGFAVELADEDRDRLGDCDPGSAPLLVTVRAAPDPADITVNLRAPLVIWEGRGFQVLNEAPGAELQAPLFAVSARQPTADAA